jgi:excisionase family DNA binding protein
MPDTDRKPERLLLRVEEAAERLSISRAKAYELLSTGEIGSIKIGRSRRILASELSNWVEKEVAAQSRRS